MKKSRALKLVNSLINYEIDGSCPKAVIEILHDNGFKRKELVEVGFCKSYVNYALGKKKNKRKK